VIPALIAQLVFAGHSQIANVGRIMKNSLPDSAKIAKEAKECVQECVSEFISFLVRASLLQHPMKGPA
jgi:hypothetical protein